MSGAAVIWQVDAVAQRRFQEYLAMHCQKLMSSKSNRVMLCHCPLLYGYIS
jgi:hypothetical protein